MSGFDGKTCPGSMTRLPTEPTKAPVATLDWGNFVVTRPDGVTEVHTVPYNDLEHHQLWEMCDCRPQEDCRVAGAWVHSSFDGRERHQCDGAPMH